MGRCNGGGGRRHGGGGFQEGQNKGTKSGKAGHGKSGAHDSTSSQRELQRRDKYGQPLNYGPFRNGYYVGGEKKPTAEAQDVGIAQEQCAALSLVAAATRDEPAPPNASALQSAGSSSTETSKAEPAPKSQRGRRSAHTQRAAAATA